MKRAFAIEHANQMLAKTGEEHYVIWDPASFREVLTKSGYRVKSETQMIEDYGSVENYSFHVVYMSQKIA